MTQKEKIKTLIDIVELLTKRLKKVEIHSINKAVDIIELKKRIEVLENKQ